MRASTMDLICKLGYAIEHGDKKTLTNLAIQAALDLDAALAAGDELAERRRRDCARRRRRLDIAGGEVPPGLRYAILEGDGFRCRTCGDSPETGATLEIDHIVPVAAGGTNAPDNLQTLCRLCNGGKSDSTAGPTR